MKKQVDASSYTTSRDTTAVLFEQNDEWATQHRYMQVEAFSEIDTAEVGPILSTTTEAA
jgi:hypothetical protein